MKFDRRRTGFVRNCPAYARRLLACATLATLAVSGGSLCAQPASPPEQHERAMQAYETSHYAEAARLLEAPCAAGHARSLEVLGLMHWYGAPLYGQGPWDRARGHQYLARAADAGSEVAAAVGRAALRRSNGSIARTD